MVLALEKAWRALRPGGHVVDIEPDESRLPRVALYRGRRPVLVGSIERDADEDVMAAQRALDRSLGRGLFTPVAVVDHEYLTRFASVAAFEAEWRCHPSWHPNRDLRTRLGAAGSAARPPSWIATVWWLRLTVLRRNFRLRGSVYNSGPRGRP